MGVLEEVQAYILANSTVFKRGSSTGSKVPIFLGETPSSGPDACVGIYETGGAPPYGRLGGTTPYVRRPGIQVLARAGTYPLARTYASVIWDLLYAALNANFPLTPGSTSSRLYLSADPNQDLIDLGRDPKHRQMFSSNFLLNRT